MLPPEVRAMHDNRGTAHAEGVATIVRGQSLLARLVGFLFRFPETGAAVSVAVRLDVADGVETWTRTFAGQSPSPAVNLRATADRTGCCASASVRSPSPWRCCRTVIVCGWCYDRWSFLGIPLPTSLCPRSDSYETGKDGRFYFHVEIGHRLTGPIVRYRGWLVRSS